MARKDSIRIDSMAKKLMLRDGETGKTRQRKREEKPPLSLVTGASGRLGGYLLKALLQKGEHVRVLQRKSGSQPHFPEGVEVVYGDLADRAALDTAVTDVDKVFHLAAVVSHSAPMELLLEVNYKGTRNLLDACRSKAYALRRFVFVSSIDVFGKKIEHLPADEDTPTNPSSWYGRSKLMAEEVVKQYTDRIPCVIIRPAIIYGAGFEEGYIPMLSALEKQKMPIIGNGENIIPFVHASDVVRGLLLASDAEAAPGNTYVLASDERKTQREILQIACRHLGVQPPQKSTSVSTAKLKLQLANLISPITGKKPKLLEEHIDIISANRSYSIGRAKKDLGYQPAVKLEEGIGEMVEYYRSMKGGAL